MTIIDPISEGYTIKTQCFIVVSPRDVICIPFDQRYAGTVLFPFYRIKNIGMMSVYARAHAFYLTLLRTATRRFSEIY